MAKQVFHFRGPLRMRRAAQPKTLGEKAGPIFAITHVAAFAEASAPKVLRAFFAVRVMRVAKKPSRERFFFVAGRNNSSGARELVRFGRKQALESGNGKFARIERMIGGELRIADVGMEWQCEENDKSQSAKCRRHDQHLNRSVTGLAKIEMAEGFEGGN